MGYLLLWMELLTASLLLVGCGAAYSARLWNGPLRWLLAALAVFLPLGFFCALTAADGHIEFNRHVHLGWWWPLVALCLAILTGVIVIHSRAWKRVPETERTRAFAWPAGKLAAALAVTLLLTAMTFMNLDEAVKQSLATLRIEATARAQAVAPERVPDHENAAILYEQVFDAMDSDSAESPLKKWPDVWQQAVEAIRPEFDGQFDFNSPELGTFLESHAGEVQVLKAAAERPGCYFERDYGWPSMDMPLPELADLRNAAWLLAIHARWAAARGDQRTALSDINAIYALGRHTSNEPMLIVTLCAAAFDQVASRSLATVLRSAHPAADELALVSMDGNHSYRRLMQRTMRMDETFVLALMAGLDGRDTGRTLSILGGQATDNLFSLEGSLYREVLLSDDLVAYRNWMHGNEDAMAQRTYPEVTSRLATLEAESVRQRGGILTALLTPSFTGANQASVQADARHAVAQVGLAMHRYRAQQRTFPDKLAELSPRALAIVPRDPYTGGPLKFNKTANGWTVYSVGPDGKDNQGAPFDEAHRTGDFIFEYVEPAPAQQPAAEKAPPQEPAAP